MDVDLRAAVNFVKKNPNGLSFLEKAVAEANVLDEIVKNYPDLVEGADNEIYHELVTEFFNIVYICIDKNLESGEEGREIPDQMKRDSGKLGSYLENILIFILQTAKMDRSKRDEGEDSMAIFTYREKLHSFLKDFGVKDLSIEDAYDLAAEKGRFVRANREHGGSKGGGKSELTKGRSYSSQPVRKATGARSQDKVNSSINATAEIKRLAPPRNARSVVIDISDNEDEEHSSDNGDSPGSDPAASEEEAVDKCEPDDHRRSVKQYQEKYFIKKGKERLNPTFGEKEKQARKPATIDTSANIRAERPFAHPRNKTDNGERNATATRKPRGAPSGKAATVDYSSRSRGEGPSRFSQPPQSYEEDEEDEEVGNAYQTRPSKMPSSQVPPPPYTRRPTGTDSTYTNEPLHSSPPTSPHGYHPAASTFVPWLASPGVNPTVAGTAFASAPSSYTTTITDSFNVYENRGQAPARRSTGRRY